MPSTGALCYGNCNWNCRQNEHRKHLKRFTNSYGFRDCVITPRMTVYQARLSTLKKQNIQWYPDTEKYSLHDTVFWSQESRSVSEMLLWALCKEFTGTVFSSCARTRVRRALFAGFISSFTHQTVPYAPVPTWTRSRYLSGTSQTVLLTSWR